MPMNKAQKAAAVEVIAEKFKTAEILILAQNKGLTSQAANDLRVSARAAGVDYRVVKNTLAKIAAKGTNFEGLADQMKGPTAYVTGSDPVATAKVLADFAKKNNKLVIIGAKFGDMMMDEAAVNKFATMPTMDEIRSQLIGLLMAPAQQIAAVVKAYSEKDGAIEAAPSAPADEPAPEATPAE